MVWTRHHPGPLGKWAWLLCRGGRAAARPWQFWRCAKPLQRCKICKSRHQVPLYNQQLRFLSITVNVDNFDSRPLSRPSIAPNLGMSFQRFAVYKAQLFFPVAKISLPWPASCSQVAMIDTFLGKYIHLYIYIYTIVQKSTRAIQQNRAKMPCM